MNPATSNTRAPLFFAASGTLFLLAVMYLSLSTTIVELPGDRGGHLAHAGAYTLLMFLFSRVGRGMRFAMLTAGALIALGVAIEFLQAQTGYRNFEGGDMLANAIGVACGWLAGFPFNTGLRGAKP